MTTYNHAFTIAWDVSHSKYESWEECLINEQESILDALRARLAEVDGNRHEMMDAISGFDTYEED